jgi:cation:H+ antiporter
MNLILLAVGLVLVVKGADWLVDGSSSLAKRLKVSDLIIGLTIVALGTSMPELVVNIFSSVNKNPGIAVGNILGSNIANIFLILGVAAIIYPLKVKNATIWKEIPFSLIAIIVVGLLANDILIDGGLVSALTRIDGLILICFFVFFLYHTFNSAQKERKNRHEMAKEANLLPAEKTSLAKAIILITSGLVFLILGGNWIVQGAISLAQALGVSSSLIGLTIVAVGTSFPELVTSAVAAWKKKSDIAIGNVVGSNIFNLFWVLGISSIIYPLPFLASNNFDILMVIIASVLLFFFMFIGKKKHVLERWQGFLMVLIYVVYIVFSVYRG